MRGSWERGPSGRTATPRRAWFAVAMLAVGGAVVAACVPPPSDPGSPPTTLVPLSDPPGSFNVLAYNVAGLPQGISGSNPEQNMALISPLLNDYDVVLTQEDFDWWQPAAGLLDFVNYHTRLRADATHPYRSDRHPGYAAVGISPQARPLLVGDGIGLMARYPLTDETVRPWTQCFGDVFSGAADCLAMKGFRMMTMTLGDGFEVDVYSLHGEAGGTARDQQLQAQDFDELAAFITSRGADRAIIVGGDTNLHTDRVDPDGAGGADIEIYRQFLLAAELTDVCTALGCDRPGSIDKFAYRSGSGVELSATTIDFPSARFSDAGGRDLSDHEPVVATFDWDASTAG